MWKYSYSGSDGVLYIAHLSSYEQQLYHNPPLKIKKRLPRQAKQLAPKHSRELDFELYRASEAVVSPTMYGVAAHPPGSAAQTRHGQ